PAYMNTASARSAITYIDGDAGVQLLDRVAPVLQNSSVAVDVGDRAARRGGVHVGRVVCHQAEVLGGGLDLPQVQRPDGPTFDRQLVGPSRAVVGDRERLLRGHCAVPARPLSDGLGA